MKAPKNRIKAFRVDCLNCRATQDSLRATCKSCGKPLYANANAEELATIAGHVDRLEEALQAIEQPPQGKERNPYQHLDQAWSGYRALRTHNYIPGMPHYLDRVLEVILPYKLRIMQRTLKANLILMVVLVAFPVATLALGMHWSVPTLLGLPAIVWGLVTLKASKDVARTREQLDKISEA